MQFGQTDFSSSQPSLWPESCQRRSVRRTPYDVTVEIETGNAGKTCQCQVVDLSRHGLGFLDCGALAHVAENATLIIWLTHDEDSPLPVIGKIVHRREYGAFRHLGIEFESEGAEMVDIGSAILA